MSSVATKTKKSPPREKRVRDSEEAPAKASQMRFRSTEREPRKSQSRASHPRGSRSLAGTAKEAASAVYFENFDALTPMTARIGVAGGKGGFSEFILAPLKIPTENSKIVYGWSGNFKGIRIDLPGEEPVYATGIASVLLPVRE